VQQALHRTREEKKKRRVLKKKVDRFVVKEGGGKGKTQTPPHRGEGAHDPPVPGRTLYQKGRNLPSAPREEGGRGGGRRETLPASERAKKKILHFFPMAASKRPNGRRYLIGMHKAK